MTRTQLEDILRHYSLNFLPQRQREVEDERFPPMAVIFRQCLESDRLPTQDKFIHAVQSQYEGTWTPAHSARATRAYVANIQQYHFELLLGEIFHQVEWNESLDLREGIDVAVHHKGKQFGFAVHVQTPRADSFVERKRNRYRPSMPVLDVLIQPRRYCVGRFWLYHPQDIGEVIAFTETNQ